MDVPREKVEETQSKMIIVVFACPLRPSKLLLILSFIAHYWLTSKPILYVFLYTYNWSGQECIEYYIDICDLYSCCQIYICNKDLLALGTPD